MKLDLIEAESAKATIDETVEPLENELTQKYGVGQRERAARGLRQVASLWLEEDGDATQFAEFARTHFAGDQAALEAGTKDLKSHFARAGPIDVKKAELRISGKPDIGALSVDAPVGFIGTDNIGRSDLIAQAFMDRFGS